MDKSVEMSMDEVNYLGAQVFVGHSGVETLFHLFELQIWKKRLQFKQHQKMWYNELQRHIARAKTLYSNIISETYGWTGQIEITDDKGKLKKDVTSTDIADQLQTEGCDVARLMLLWANATYHHPENVLKIESMLKLMAKEPCIPTELIESIRL